MNNTVNRFLDSTIRYFIPKNYTREQVIQKLQTEIGMLERQLISNEYSSQTMREKAQLLRDKKNELEEFQNQTV